MSKERYIIDDVLWGADDNVPPFIPVCTHYAGSERFIEKARQLQSTLSCIFDVTIDLEDGAEVGQEKRQLELAIEMLNKPWAKRVGVRIHDLDSPFWRSELISLCQSSFDRLAFITIPKVRSAAQISEVSGILSEQTRASGTGHHVPLHLLIETHEALMDLKNLAALPLVESLDFGLLDFISAHHGAISSLAMRSPAQFEQALIARAKSDLVANALAFGKVPSHNICVEIDSPETAFHDAKRAKEQFGFLRMWSIHPSQIEPICKALTPSFEELSLAEEVLFKAQGLNWAPLRFAGELHDRASYRFFWSTLRRARSAGLKISPPAERLLFQQAR